MDPQQQNNIQLPEEEGIDIKKYIFLILSHWWWFAITLFISVTVVYLINRYSQEVYSASCSIIVGEEQASSGSVESILGELSRVRNRKRKAVVENEISILKSYSMARKALEELDFGVTYIEKGRRNIAERQLYKASPFKIVLDTNNIIEPNGSFNLTIISKNKFQLSINDTAYQIYNFGDNIKKNNIKFRIILRDPENFTFNNQASNKFNFSFNNINHQAKAYSNALNVAVNDEKGSILTLSISGFVPFQIADYLNKLCEIYIHSNLQEKNLTSENTINFIDDQLRGVVDSLEITGLRLQRFRSANKVIDLSKEGNFLFTKMQDLQSEKATLDINSRYYNYLLEYIEKKKDFSDVVAPSVVGIQDHLLNSLVAKLNELNLQRRNLSLSVVENSPQVSMLNNQIVNTRNALQENLESLIAGNEIALVELNERIIKIESEVQKLPGTERQLINIQREFTINDQIYTFLLEKRAEAGIARASNTSDHKILDIARSENAVMIKPKSSTNYLIAITIGGFIPLALLLLINFFNTKITNRDYLEFHLKPPVVGNIGHNDKGSDLPVNEEPKSSLAESFRGLRTNLNYILNSPDEKVVAVSSAVSGEGKTFTSVNLASIIAMSGKKTLLVSLDLRKPKVHKIFNLQNKIGISTFLINKNSFDEIVLQSNINNLHIINSGPVPPNPAELIGSDNMKEFLEIAKLKYDSIILDTPPIAIVTDTLTITGLLDAFIFVIRHNYSSKHIIELVNNLYSKQLIKNINVVVNDIQVKDYYGYSNKYGYGYSYNYNQAYYGEDSKDRSILHKIFNL
jgi:capsular exopolysaccharide synthesis family protein